MMTGSRPALYWMICWKYISPAAMVTILLASFMELASSGSNYPAWVASKGITESREWPHWCIVLAIFLIVVSVIWIPVIAIARYVHTCHNPGPKQIKPARFIASVAPNNQLIVELVSTVYFGFIESASVLVLI